MMDRFVSEKMGGVVQCR